MTKEQLIEEARKRGIVPGAVVKTRWHNDWTLGTTDAWVETNGEIYDASPRNGACIFYKNTWAEVVTPTPAQEPEGLVDGMACEPDEHMRAAIVAKVDQLGIGGKGRWRFADTSFPGIGWNGWLIGDRLPKGMSGMAKTWITPGEFYDRLCRMPKREPPIEVGDYTVQFNNGSIKVGCTIIDNATVRAIAAKLKD